MLCKTNPRVSLSLSLPLSLYIYIIHLYHCILHKHVQQIVWKPTYLHWRNFREVRESLVVGKISRCEPVLKWPLHLIFHIIYILVEKNNRRRQFISGNWQINLLIKVRKDVNWRPQSEICKQNGGKNDREKCHAAAVYSPLRMSYLLF